MRVMELAHDRKMGYLNSCYLDEDEVKSKVINILKHPVKSNPI